MRCLLDAQHGIHAAPLRGHLRRSFNTAGVIQSTQIHDTVRFAWGDVVDANPLAAPSLMRLLPLQIAMLKLCGEWMPFVEPNELPLTQRLMKAHDSLVAQTGHDFGYNLNAWHDYLCTGDGYTWSSKHLTIAAAVRDAMSNSEWTAAVAEIEDRAQPGG